MQRTLRTASSSAPEGTADHNDHVETGRAHPRMSAPNFNWVLQSVAQLQRIPFDAGLLAQQFPPPYTRSKLMSTLHVMRFRTGEGRVADLGGDTISFPCLAFRLDRSRDSSEQLVPVIVVSCSAGTVLYFESSNNEAKTSSLEDFVAACQTMLLLFRHQAADSTDPDTATTTSEPFGFRWFIPELLKHQRIWRDVLFASLAIQLVALAMPVFTQIVIDKVVVHQTQSTLWAVGVALIMFTIFSAVMTWMRQYLVLHTGNRVDAVLGEAVFRHLFRLPMPYFEQRQTGVLVARLQGVEQIREFVSGAAVTLLLDCPFLIVILAVMVWYSWQLSLIAVVILGLIVALSVGVSPLFRSRLDRQFMIGAKNSAFITEYVSGMATVKSLQMEPVLEERYGEQLAQYLAAGFATRQLANSYNVLANTLEQVMTLAILVIGALLVMDSAASAATGAATFTIGMLVAFQMFASRMSQPMLRLVGLWQQFQQARIAVRRLSDVMNMPVEPHAIVPKRPPEPRAKAGHIEFKGVSFRYAPDHPWLFRELDLQFKPGRFTVLMGPSGSGKSTLAKLLQGFYPPADGRILIDGQDIGHLGANELRACFGVVPQETTLFSGTVYDNLQLANPQADFKQIAAACRMAEIHDVIEALPQGYQTPLGERGVGLSGGQRQRIAIARALLKRPRVLIFDEATSNLDAATAERFAQTVNQLKGKVTIIFIAHQLPKGLNVDEVVEFGVGATKFQ